MPCTSTTRGPAGSPATQVTDARVQRRPQRHVVAQPLRGRFGRHRARRRAAHAGQQHTQRAPQAAARRRVRAVAGERPGPAVGERRGRHSDPSDGSPAVERAMSSQSRASVTGLTCFAVSIARARPTHAYRAAFAAHCAPVHDLIPCRLRQRAGARRTAARSTVRAWRLQRGDVRAAQALRFEVFNMELDEGLVQSYDTGLDVDPFDAVCDHLIVEDTLHGSVIGTYRLQTGRRAAEALGYYSEREFDFGPFEARRAQILELGRACIHREHRSFAVLNLLWKGIAGYAQRTRHALPDRLQFADLAGRGRRRCRLRAAAGKPRTGRLAHAAAARPGLRAEQAGRAGAAHPAPAFGLPGAGGGRSAARRPSTGSSAPSTS